MENNKQKNTGLIVVLVIAMLVIGFLIGYIIFGLDNITGNNVTENNKVQDTEVGNNESEENKDAEVSKENIPYLEGLKGITYNSSGEDGIYKSRISDVESMKQVLSIFKNKTITGTPDGIGGAGSLSLILEYETSEIEIYLLATNLVEIDNKYYNVNYTGDYYSILEKIFK